MTVSRSARNTLVQNVCMGDEATGAERVRDRRSVSTVPTRAIMTNERTTTVHDRGLLPEMSLWADVILGAQSSAASETNSIGRRTKIGLYPPRGTSSRRSSLCPSHL